MRPETIVPNAFLDNLGTDWIAVAANGHIVGRATTREAVERSTPKAVAYYCQKDLDHGSKHAGKAALADPVGFDPASLEAMETAEEIPYIEPSPALVDLQTAAAEANAAVEDTTGVNTLPADEPPVDTTSRKRKPKN